MIGQVRYKGWQVRITAQATTVSALPPPLGASLRGQTVSALVEPSKALCVGGTKGRQLGDTNGLRYLPTGVLQ